MPTPFSQLVQGDWGRLFTTLLMHCRVALGGCSPRLGRPSTFPSSSPRAGCTRYPSTSEKMIVFFINAHCECNQREDPTTCPTTGLINLRTETKRSLFFMRV